MTDPSTTPPRPPRITPRSDRAATHPADGSTDARAEEPRTPWLAAFAVLAAIAFAAWTVGDVVGRSDDPAADVGGLWTLAGVVVGVGACVCGVIGMATEMRSSLTDRRRSRDAAASAPPRSGPRRSGGRPSSPTGRSSSARGRERAGSA